MTVTTKPIVWVDQPAQLAELCASWRKLELLALDTEFIRTRTYYPVPALLQVFDGSGNYLIDPTVIDNFEPLADLMGDAAVTKVLHSCSEDLEVFAYLLGRLPESVCDTQVAAALCGHGHSVGYANLVNNLLGISLPKDETRSDWLQRPLTEAQQLYAALDVQYLYSLARQLFAELEQLGRRAWLDEEYQRLKLGFKTGEDTDVGVSRFKLAWRLTPRQLGVLQRLATWREQMARDLNIPRNRLVPERSLYQIAELLPGHISQLHQIDEMPARTVRLYGEELIDIVRCALAEQENQLPAPLPRPLASEQKKQLQELRDRFTRRAQSLRIAPEIFARKSDFEHMVRALDAGLSGRQVLPPTFTGWREQCVLDEMLEGL